MKRLITFIWILALGFGILVSCRPKKCANFTDAKGGHHVKYNKKGLVKKKH
jgi:hypothetical protein